MSKREILITVDEASMGDDEAWTCVESYCAMLKEAIQAEFQNADVTVEPERSTFNGGRTLVYGDWDGYASEDVVLNVIKHRAEQIYADGEWLDD